MDEQDVHCNKLLDNFIHNSADFPHNIYDTLYDFWSRVVPALCDMILMVDTLRW